MGPEQGPSETDRKFKEPETGRIDDIDEAEAMARAEDSYRTDAVSERRNAAFIRERADFAASKAEEHSERLDKMAGQEGEIAQDAYNRERAQKLSEQIRSTKNPKERSLLAAERDMYNRLAEGLPREGVTDNEKSTYDWMMREKGSQK